MYQNKGRNIKVCSNALPYNLRYLLIIKGYKTYGDFHFHSIKMCCKESYKYLLEGSFSIPSCLSIFLSKVLDAVQNVISHQIDVSLVSSSSFNILFRNTLLCFLFVVCSKTSKPWGDYRGKDINERKHSQKYNQPHHQIGVSECWCTQIEVCVWISQRGLKPSSELNSIIKSQVCICTTNETKL